MTTRTGASLGNFDALERIEPLPRERHTYCVTEQVDNPSLRAAMSFFDDSLGAPLIPGSSLHGAIRSQLKTITGSCLRVFGALDTGLAAHSVGTFADAALGSVVGSVWIAGQRQESVHNLEPVSETSADKLDDVVDVVRDLQRRLGIDLKDVLAAASIKPRTYHSWAQPSAPRPRLTSQGRLWALAQLVDDLPEVLNVPIRQWLLADSKRLMALQAGRFDALLEQASQERMQQGPAGTVAGPFHGVGEDSPLPLRTTSRELVVDEQAIIEPALPPRRPPALPQI